MKVGEDGDEGSEERKERLRKKGSTRGGFDRWGKF